LPPSSLPAADERSSKPAKQKSSSSSRSFKPPGVRDLTADDYFEKSSEFTAWLLEEEHKYFNGERQLLCSCVLQVVTAAGTSPLQVPLQRPPRSKISPGDSQLQWWACSAHLCVDQPTPGEEEKPQEQLQVTQNVAERLAVLACRAVV
jgi:hypothetical protein